MAIILVVLSHGWTLWPMDRIVGSSVLRPIFTSGNFAVSIFFVVGGFVGVRSLMVAVEHDGTLSAWDGLVRVTRRLVRLGAHVWALLAVVLFLAVLDPTEMFPETMTRNSVIRAATFTWNWYLRDHALNARSDLGHLWYLSVDLQVFIVLVALVWWLGRRPLHLAGVLIGLILLVTEWRAHALVSESLVSVEVRTTTRMDGLLWGALAAVAFPHIRRVAPYAAALLWGSIAALLALVFTTGNDPSYYRQNGVLINLALVAFVVGVSFLPRSAAVAAVSFRPLALLGRHSLPIYVWHYPVFWACARWAEQWGWGVLPKALLGFALTGVLSALAYRVIEVPVQTFLARTTGHQLTSRAAQSRRAVSRLVGSHRRTTPATLAAGSAPDASAPASRGR